MVCLIMLDSDYMISSSSLSYLTLPVIIWFVGVMLHDGALPTNYPDPDPDPFSVLPRS